MAEELRDEEVVETNEEEVVLDETDEVETETVEDEVETEEVEVDEGSGTFTQEEVNEIVKNRLSRKDNEFKKELDKLVNEKLAEAKRQEQLTEEQKEAERLQNLAKELEDKQRELDFRDRFSEAESGLRKLDLDPRFAQWLVNEDKETTEANIKEFQSLFDKAVELRSVDKLRGKTPKANKTQKSKGVTKEEYNNMGYSERMALKAKDPVLYEQLSKL